MSSLKSNWRSLPGVTTKASVVWIFINDLDDGADQEGILRKSADDTKLGEVVDRPDGHAATCRDLSRAEKWTG